MWVIYENEVIDLDDLDDKFYGVTNDPISAEKLVKDGFMVVDMDTWERFE